MNTQDLGISIFPDMVLYKKAEQLSEVEILKYYYVLRDAMDKLQTIAIGVALPQLGINKAGFAYNSPKEKRTLYCFNPVILSSSKGFKDNDEGCLSLPGMTFRVKRRESIVVRYLNHATMVEEVALDGDDAIIFQHEVDHLNSILIKDKCDQTSRLKNKNKVKDLEKNAVSRH